MKTYGLTEYQIKKANDKLAFNKEFMRTNGIQLDGRIVPFADFVANSYINSHRYVAELQHRAWSIYEYAEERNLKNIFITLTLPSAWHAKKTFKNKLINNPKFGGRKYIATIQGIKFINAQIIQHVPFIEPVLDFSQTVDKYTPRNASKELSKMLSKLLKDRSYTSIDKQDRCYFRVTEPHKDGTPHLHISLFVPEDKKERIVKALKRLYPAPMGKIETDVISPVKYLMKYVLKTLDDLRDEKSSISNLTLWYLYHGISRFYTSRTFVALEVYRKLNGMYSLRQLTKDYRNQDIAVYLDSTSRKISSIENEFGTIYTPKPVNWLEKLEFNSRLSEDKETIMLDSGFEPLFREKIVKPVDVIIDGESFLYINKEIVKPKKKPYQMTDYELYTYFHDLDIDLVDDKHYIYTQNLLIERGYLDADILPLDAMQQVDDYFELEGAF
jgi:hypothetical protein